MDVIRRIVARIRQRRQIDPEFAGPTDQELTDHYAALRDDDQHP